MPVSRAKLLAGQVVSSDTVNPSMKTRCFKVLRKVSPAHGILPKSYQVAAVTLTDGTPYTSGRFADIWVGQLDGRQVCVKAVRTQTAANLGKIKRVCCGVSTESEHNLIITSGSIGKS
jgi:hypothetical protein